MTSHKQMPIVPGKAKILLALQAAIVVAITVVISTLPAVAYRKVWELDTLALLWIGFIAYAVYGFVLPILRDQNRRQIEISLLEAFLEHIPDNVFFKDLDSRFIRVSNAMAGHFGLSDPAQAIGKSDTDMFSADHAEKARLDEERIIRTGQPMIGKEEKETWPDGRESWVLTTKVALRDQQGAVVGTVGISQDITDRKQAEARIRYMALHDGLTGLANRTLLQDRLAQAIGLACRNKKCVGTLLVDIDRFKSINDSLGHYVGDRLLEAVAMRLRVCLRESDIVARLGADEFALGLQMMSGREGIEQAAQKVLATLVEPFQIEGHELRISGSIGISQYPADGENPEALLRAADAAMYDAKAQGRGVYRFFTSELNEATKHRLQRETDLLKACERGEFLLHYQPILSAESGNITGVEALLRWQHPTQGMISPNQFIPHLEELGLMGEVGRWVLRTACLQNVEWQQQGLKPIRMAVNVSAQQFHLGDIAKTVREVLSESGLDPKWLELELTESLALHDAESSVAIMKDLKRMGVSLSLDDFGTGWSSLSYLRRFPLDRIKIDRSFMRDIATQPAAEAVVRSIISLSRSLGFDCVAEGVESRQQLEYLQRQSCPEVQGFLFSAPLLGTDCGQLQRSWTDENYAEHAVLAIDAHNAESTLEALAS
jgi:diguanylate cyclase (GGDEF)-like protein/PAS domain S-box-containing protein